MNRWSRFDTHGQPLSRAQIRAAAGRAFVLRNRVGASAVRPPEPGETPLSIDEVAFGLRRGLIGQARFLMTGSMSLDALERRETDQ